MNRGKKNKQQQQQIFHINVTFPSVETFGSRSVAAKVTDVIQIQLHHE